MKLKYPAVVIILLLFHLKSSAQFSQVFSTDYINNNLWDSNNFSEWEIIESSTVAGGSNGSNTLKLNATASNSLNYLSIQNTSGWGVEQTWSFWIGRDNCVATTNNANYVWLYAKKPDFSDLTNEGYRIRFGGNTDEEDVILEVVNGSNVKEIINDNNVVPSTFSDYGITVYVTRTALGEWTIYSSENPEKDKGGVNSNADPVLTTLVNRNKNGQAFVDLTFTNFTNGYFGFMAVQQSATNPLAKRAAEFDQFNFLPAINKVSYTWVGVSGTSYGEKTNWTPERIIKRNTDELIFDRNSVVTELTNDIVSSISFVNSSTTSIMTSSSAEVTVTNKDKVAFLVESNCALIVNGTFPLTINLPKGVKGEVAGSISFSKSVSGDNVSHKILITDKESFTVSGSFTQNCNGNIFGSGSTDEHRVIFKAGSEFILKAGANPFGSGSAPRVRFDHGSWYRHQTNTAFATSGLIYSNFELNLPNPLSNVTIISGQNLPTTVDNFVITQGGLIVSHTTGLFTFNINGDLNIGSNGRMTINRVNQGTSLINLLGENAAVTNTISITGDFEIGKTGTLKIANNYKLLNDIVVRGIGTLCLFSGILDLNTFKLTFPDAFTIQKIQGHISHTPETNSNLVYIYGDGFTPGIISTGAELQDNASSITINNQDGFVLFKPVSLSNSLNLNLGKLFSSGVNYVTLEVNSTVENASDLSFVAGPIAKVTNSVNEFSFPVGQENYLRPLVIAPSSSDETTFLAKYNNTPPPYHNVADAIEDPLKSISEVESWEIKRIQGKTNLKVKLFWTDRSGITILDPEAFDLRVARFDGTVWKDKGDFDHLMIDENQGFVASEDLSDAENIITFGSVSENTSFPVTFLEFRGTIENSKVILTWTTTLEVNNKGFQVEKSSNGIDFTSIGFVQPSDNEDLKKKYIFVDTEADSTAFYRLRQMDYNGDFKFSNVIIVNVPEGATTYFIHPNPLREKFEVILANKYTKWIRVEIRNIQGIMIAYYEGSPQELNRELNDKMTYASQGVYYFSFINNKIIRTVKVVKD